MEAMSLDLTGNDPFYTEIITVAVGVQALELLLPETCNRILVQPVDDICYTSYSGTDGNPLTDYGYQPLNSMVKYEIFPDPHGNRQFFVQVPTGGDTIAISLLQG